MGYVNDDIKSTESMESTESTKCNVCGYEKKCFIQDKFGQEQEVCLECIFTEDRDY